MITEEAFLDFNCPYCGTLNSFPAESAGFVRECVNCQEAVIVPEDGSTEGRKVPIPLTTSSLVLRRLGPADWKDLAEIRPDFAEVDLLQWLDAACKAKLTASDRPFCLGIEAQANGKLIGYLELQFADRGFIEAEIDADWNPNPQFRVLVLEAVAATLNLCFTELKMHRVIARCGGTDADGCRLWAEAGMRREGEFVKHNFNEWDGKWYNTVWFAMLEEEFCSDDTPANQASTD